MSTAVEIITPTTTIINNMENNNDNNNNTNKNEVSIDISESSSLDDTYDIISIDESIKEDETPKEDLEVSPPLSPTTLHIATAFLCFLLLSLIGLIVLVKF
ncbi:hypothetical protein CYY_007589, partial [Polysphondylium violaceum]